jgi:RNA polymerase-binding transcription factor DksA
MTKAQLSGYRKKLQSLLERLSGEESRLRQEVRHPGGDAAVEQQGSSEDLGRALTDDEVAISLLGNEEDIRRECNAALDRIDRGAFGQCEKCGKPISKQRLDALPYARSCIECARQE